MPLTVDETYAAEVPLSHEATMVGYLMESGWLLHVQHLEPRHHKLMKSVRTNGVSRIQKVRVSADAVIEIHSANMLRKKSWFSIAGQETTVYERTPLSHPRNSL